MNETVLISCGVVCLAGMVLIWKALSCVTVTSGVGLRALERERHGHQAQIERLIEKLICDPHRMANTHASERMTQANIDAATERAAIDASAPGTPSPSSPELEPDRD